MTAAQQKLVVDNMALAPYVVNKYFPHITYFEKEDMYSIGYIAMCRAARDFDPKRGWKYVTLAGKYIRMAICNEIQKATRARRDVRNCATTFDQLATSPSGRETETLGSFIPAVDDAETITDAKLLIEWLDSQCETDAKVVRLHIAGYSQGEIAREVGMTQSSVSRHLSAAKFRIKRYYDRAI